MGPCRFPEVTVGAATGERAAGFRRGIHGNAETTSLNSASVRACSVSVLTFP